MTAPRLASSLRRRLAYRSKKRGKSTSHGGKTAARPSKSKPRSSKSSEGSKTKGKGKKTRSSKRAEEEEDQLDSVRWLRVHTLRRAEFS